MLPAAHRMRRAVDFSETTRRGLRAGRGSVVVYLLPPADAVESGPVPALVGLTVGRSVGNAVVRHRTSRRLRHLAAARLASLPAGSTLVIRALSGAGDASSAELGRDLDAALARVLDSGAR